MVSTKNMSQDQDLSPQETDPKVKTMEQSCEFIPISPLIKGPKMMQASEDNSSWRNSAPSERGLEPKGHK